MDTGIDREVINPSHQRRAAGFWVRLFTTVIDFTLPMVIGIAIAFAFLTRDNGHYIFRAPYLFYVWGLITIALMITSFILVPWFTKGRSLGMMISRTQIEFHKAVLPSLIKREMLMGLVWVLSLFMVVVVINHTLIDKYARSDQGDIHYSNWEKVRIGIVSTVSSFLLIAQMFCFIGIIIKNDKCGFHDRVSETRTVWTNRFTTNALVNSLPTIAPRPVKNEIIEWV